MLAAMRLYRPGAPLPEAVRQRSSAMLRKGQVAAHPNGAKLASLVN
jgi:hypothetical protein